MFSLNYHELVGKMEGHDEKKYIFIDTNDKLPNYIPLKNVAILMRCVIKDYGKFYPLILLEEVLLNKLCIQQGSGIGACRKMRKIE